MPRAYLRAAAKFIIRLAYGGMFRQRGGKDSCNVKPPSRILLLSGAHIGDVVISTCVIPILRSAYPDAEIGMMTGSWSHMVVRNHPELTYTHRVDHWRLNRAGIGMYSKMLQYLRTRRTALRELKQIKYDVAISMSSYFPDFLDFACKARIPVRIGYNRSLLSCLATNLIQYPENPFVHQGARIAELLRALPIESASFRLRRSSLPASDASSVQEVCFVLGVPSIEGARYRIVHMGSGEVRREFPVAFWRDLAERLSPAHTLVFTGRGAREARNIEVAIEGLRNCVNACDRFSWSGFVAAVRHAEIVYGVESMAGHVAAAVGTRSVVAYGGMAGVAQWRPEGADTIVFTNHVACAPCHQPSGCEAMTCTRGFTPSDLIRFGP